MTDEEFFALVHYPFHVRPDRWAYLYLPPDLTQADVARLVVFLESLVKEPESGRDAGLL